MKYSVTIEIQADNKDLATQAVELIGLKPLRVTPIKDKRTKTQNDALHLWCQQLSEALNEAGFDMKQVITMDIPWSKETVKEYMIRPTIKKMLLKQSTTELTRDEITTVYDVINRALAFKKIPVHVPFPSIDTLTDQNK